MTPDIRITLLAFGLVGLTASPALIATAASARTATIGRTWPIAETDALAEIDAAAQRQPVDITRRFGPHQRWTALAAASLAPATRSRVRNVVPFHTLDFDIRGNDGRILYPKGFTFNPLSYVSLPQRLVIVAPRDLDWALSQAMPSDFILLTAGKGTDAIAASEKAERPIFLLEERIKERLGLSVAPAIVRQVGQRLEITEVSINHGGSHP